MNSKSESTNSLLLDNQICFSLYVCSKEVIRKYSPFLEPLELTYTSYITLLALWEKDNVSVKDLGEKLFLDSGTLTPLLKKMEASRLIERIRSKEDERTVIIKLTDKGKKLKEKCAFIPKEIFCASDLNVDDAKILLEKLHSMMNGMRK